jgi:hypothetical protein
VSALVDDLLQISSSIGGAACPASKLLL